MATDSRWDEQRLSHWATKAFVAGFGQVLGALRLDADPDLVTFEAVVPDESEELGWTAALWREARGDLAPDSVLGVGCSVETLQALARLVLGADPATPDEARETYSELVNQSLGILSAETSNRLGRSVQMGLAEPGERPADAVEPVFVQFQVEGSSFGVMLAPNAEWVRAVLGDTAESASSDPAAEEPVSDSAPASGQAPLASGAEYGAESNSESGVGSEASALDPSSLPQRTPDPRLLRNLDRLMDIDMEVAISFGETTLVLADVLKLSSGAIVELNRAVSDTVQLLVNDTVIAEGEVVVVEGNYGIRVTNVVSPQERVRFLL